MQAPAFEREEEDAEGEDDAGAAPAFEEEEDGPPRARAASDVPMDTKAPAVDAIASANIDSDKDTLAAGQEMIARPVPLWRVLAFLALLSFAGVPVPSPMAMVVILLGVPVLDYYAGGINNDNDTARSLAIAAVVLVCSLAKEDSEDVPGMVAAVALLLFR